MLDGIDNLIEISLHLKKSTPNFQTLRELPRIARRLRFRREQRSGYGPIYYMTLREKLEQVFVFRKLYAANLDLLT